MNRGRVAHLFGLTVVFVSVSSPAVSRRPSFSMLVARGDISMRISSTHLVVFHMMLLWFAHVPVIAISKPFPFCSLYAPPRRGG